LVPVDFDTDGVTYDPKNYEDKPEYAMVVSMGPDVHSVEPGEFVLFEKYSAMNINVFEVDFIFIKEENILSKYGS
jgi:co-chaperonin GroES (HSP10)